MGVSADRYCMSCHKLAKQISSEQRLQTSSNGWLVTLHSMLMKPNNSCTSVGVCSAEHHAVIFSTHTGLVLHEILCHSYLDGCAHFLGKLEAGSVLGHCHVDLCVCVRGVGVGGGAFGRV